MILAGLVRPGGQTGMEVSDCRLYNEGNNERRAKTAEAVIPSPFSDKNDYEKNTFGSTVPAPPKQTIITFHGRLMPLRAFPDLSKTRNDHKNALFLFLIVVTSSAAIIRVLL